MIWCRMGQNAANVPDDKMLAMLPPMLRDHPSRPRPLQPSAEECYQNSLKLAPDQLEAHRQLVALYRGRSDNGKAEKAARALLEHIPDHVETLETLADLCRQKGDHAEAISLLERALRQTRLIVICGPV